MHIHIHIRTSNSLLMVVCVDGDWSGIGENVREGFTVIGSCLFCWLLFVLFVVFVVVFVCFCFILFGVFDVLLLKLFI